MKKYKVYDPSYYDEPPWIDYEGLARQAGYSEEEIEEMFGPSVELTFYPKNTDTEPVEIQEQDLMSPLEDVPF